MVLLLLYLDFSPVFRDGLRFNFWTCSNADPICFGKAFQIPFETLSFTFVNKLCKVLQKFNTTYATFAWNKIKSVIYNGTSHYDFEL